LRLPVQDHKKTARRRFRKGFLTLFSDHVRVIRIQRVIDIRDVIISQGIIFTRKRIATARKRFIIRKRINVIWTIGHKTSVKLSYESLPGFTRFLFGLVIFGVLL